MQHIECNPENVRALIEKCGLSCAEIAKATGISEGAIHKYSTGDISFGIKNAVLLADFFAVSLDYLIGRCDEKTAKRVQENYGRHFMELRRAPYEAYLTGRAGYDNEMMLKEPTGELPWPYNIVSEVGADTLSGVKMNVDYIITKAHEKKILEIINQLKPQQRDYLLMVFRDGMTQANVARIFNCTQQSVSEVIRRGIWRLRKHPLKKWFLYGEEYYRKNATLAIKEFQLCQKEAELDAWEEKLAERQQALALKTATELC